MTNTYVVPNLPGKATESSPESAFVRPWAEPSGAQVTSPMVPSWRNVARAKRIFTGNTAAAGVVPPIFSATAQVCGLWNPLGSGVDVELLRLGLTYVSTTGAAGGFVLAVSLNAPAAVGTGLQITAFTDGALNTTIFNGRVGDTTGPHARFTPSAATVVAPIILRHLGLNQDVQPATSAVTMLAQDGNYVFNGDLILPPGTAVWIAGNIATLKTLAASITWAEHVATS